MYFEIKSFCHTTDSVKNLFGASIALGRDTFNGTDFDPTALSDICGTVNLDFTHARTASIVCDRYRCRNLSLNTIVIFTKQSTSTLAQINGLLTLAVGVDYRVDV